MTFNIKLDLIKVQEIPNNSAILPIKRALIFEFISKKLGHLGHFGSLVGLIFEMVGTYSEALKVTVSVELGYSLTFYLRMEQ